MSEPQGQILPGTVFGEILTALAINANLVVEIGTWKGGGSTVCIANGIRGKPFAKLYSFESNLQNVTEAKALHAGNNQVQIFHGTLVHADKFPPFEHIHPFMLEHYVAEKECARTCPLFEIIDESIDLLLIDGSEWTASIEMDLLIDQCKVIALDDTNPSQTVKNVRNRYKLMEMGWKVIIDNPHDRHGYFVAERP